MALILVSEKAENMISGALGANICFGDDDVQIIAPLISQSGNTFFFFNAYLFSFLQSCWCCS
jgi:hypothetical protein